MRLHRAMIFVNDLERMTAFYGETLGLKRRDATHLVDYVEFEAGSATFALHAIPAVRASVAGPAAPDDPGQTEL